MTSAHRAILVSEEQRNACWWAMHTTETIAVRKSIADAYDNAGDQPRWEICATHMGRIQHVASGWICTGFEGTSGDPCRVVSAIILIEEDA